MDVDGGIKQEGNSLSCLRRKHPSKGELKNQDAQRLPLLIELSAKLYLGSSPQSLLCVHSSFICSHSHHIFQEKFKKVLDKREIRAIIQLTLASHWVARATQQF